MPKSPSQTFLAFILAGILSLGFVGVWYVDTYTNGNEIPETLYSTDSDVIFSNFTLSDFPYSTWDYLITGRYVKSGSDFLIYEKTPVYSGNDTWLINSNYSANGQMVQYVFNVPNLENWLITSINFTTSIPTDSDLRIAMGFIHEDDSDISYDNQITNLLYNSNEVESETGSTFTKNLAIPLNTALDINSHANNRPIHTMQFQMLDDDLDGGLDFAFSLTLQIKGTRIDATSTIDQINYVVGASVGINLIAIVYLTDQFDVGGYTKALKKGRK